MKSNRAIWGSAFALIAALALAGCTAAGLLGAPADAGVATSGSAPVEERAPGKYPPPDYAVFSWRDEGTFIEDPCDEDQMVFTGSTFIRDYRNRGIHDGVRFDGWDLDWWLDGQWIPDSAPATDLIRVANYWVHPMGERTQGFEVQVRAVDSCEMAMTIHGRIRWIDGTPVPRGGVVGLDPPEFDFADTDLGRAVAPMIVSGGTDEG